MKGNLDINQLERLKKSDLQALARDLGVSDEGTVKELAARCAAVEVDAPDVPTEDENADGDINEPKENETPTETPTTPTEGKTVVEVTERYLDKNENKIKEVGEVFEVGAARAAELVAANVVKIRQ